MRMNEFLTVASLPLEGTDGHTAGRELLGRMYREQFVREMPKIAKTSMGKPYFVDESAHFSISHTAERVFCVLSDRNVAIDAEPVNRAVNPRLAQKILSAHEFTQYEQAENPAQALLKFWVLKEAAGKLSGKGVQPYPNHTNFSLDDPRIMEVHGHFVAVMTEY